jgi:phage tail sheath protein FI
MASFPTINKAPGVYIQEITLPGPIPGVSTSNAAIVGPAQSGPLLEPTLLTNFAQYTEIFGGYLETPYRVYATHAVKGFFDEGGQECYFVRVGNGAAGSLNLKDSANTVVAATPQQNCLVVTAQEEGASGSSVKIQVDGASIVPGATAVKPTATPDVAAKQAPVAVPASTSLDKLSITTTSQNDVTNFATGDLVTVTSGALTENATVASVATNAVSPPTATIITFASPLTNTYAAGSITKRDRITVTNQADAAGFLPGDMVTLTAGANSENATIASISGPTMIFLAPLNHNYIAGTSIVIALAPGDLTLRLADATGLEPGSYISISDGAKTEYNVVRLVNPVNNVITLANGLSNLYATGTGSPAITIKSMEFKLTITAAAPYPSVGTETFDQLAMDSRHSRYWSNIVSSAFVDVELADPPSTTPPPLNLPAVLAATPLAGGKDDNLSTLSTLNYHDGIDELKKISDVNLLCVPDAVTTIPVGNSHFHTSDTHDIQSYAVAHCEQMQDRFAILDPSQLAPLDYTYNGIQTQRQGLNSNNGYGALYFPWIQISSPFPSGGQILVPPSGHLAGVYATNDNLGVFHAPANEPIVSALDLEANLSDDEQGPLNSLGVNVIRSFPNEGILIWGARTIAPPDITAWRFINVRRLVTYIEKSIQEGTRFAVFQPNNLTLWQQIKRLVNDFLNTQWQEGALFGDTAAQAFRVQVDETINTPAIRALGELIVQVTLVPTTPAEFIVFRVIQDITGASLQESSAG